MSLESFNFIDSLNASNPTTTDNVSEGDDHIRGIKSTLKTTFPNINGAVNATDEEINLLDGVTATTAELNTLDGITATVAELNYTDGVTSNIQTQLGTKLPLAGGTMTGDVSLGDNVKAKFGASDDLLIFHNTADSYIYDAGTGNLNLTSDGASISLKKHTGGENMLVATPDGAVTLYHNNAEKLATTATGIDVTGYVTLDNKAIITGTDTGNPANAVVDSMRVSGYGIQANRGAMFLTNAATDGVIHMGNSGAHNANILASFTSNGLTFNGDTAAANALDDYEEGTFTPTINHVTTPDTLSYGFQHGNYTKIGRMVHVTGSMQINTVTVNGTGQIQIKGMPFSAGLSGTAAFGMGGNLTYNTTLPGSADYKTIKMYSSDAFTIEDATYQDTGELSGNLEAGYIAFTAVYYT